MNGFRIPDFALGGLIAVILATFAVLSALPNNLDNPVVWMPLFGFVLIAAAGAWIVRDPAANQRAGDDHEWPVGGGSPQRKDLAMLVVSGVTGLVIAMQFVAQRAQVDEMRSEQRAWVSVSSIKVSQEI